jgi:NADP-dependent 3-hydroxy acid dehydrogenase YdfG
MIPEEDLQGQVVMVTGASRGLGNAICQRLADKGMRIAAVARTESELAELKAQIEKDGGTCSYYPVSVADFDAMQDVVNRIVDEWGTIDVLFNNAGIHRYEPIEQMTKEMIDSVLDTNLKGTIYTTRLVAPVMMKAERGQIINITSTSAKRGLAHTGVYAATKFGQAGFADAMSKYLIRKNIRVVTLCPGGMDTTFWRDILGKDGKPLDRSANMKTDDMCDLIELILRSPSGTLYKEVVLFPTREAGQW